MVGRRPPSRRSTEYAWLITGPLALLSVFCCTALGLMVRPAFGSWIVTVVVFAAMIAAAMPTLNIVVRRQALGVTLTEIPLVLAFYFLPPLSVVLAYTLATLVVQIRRKLAPAKFWFNIVRAAAATSLANLVLLALPEIRGVGPSTWGILFAAVGTHTLVTLAAVVAVITLVQGWQAGRELVRNAPPALLTAAINVSVGLLILISLAATNWAFILLAALAGAFVLVYRSYSQFFRQHRTLGNMYQLTRAISESGQDGTLADGCSDRVRTLMQAEYATLWLPGAGSAPGSAADRRVTTTPACSTSRGPRRSCVSWRSTRAGRWPWAPGCRMTRICGAWSGRAGIKDAIIVPLRSGQAVIGTLEVVNRLGDTNHFTPGDVPVFETVAAHAAVALENSRLVDRLRFDAYHDGLTGLPNRRRISGALEEAVRVRARARWSPSCCSTSTACARSTSRWAMPRATRCSPRWPAGCVAARRPPRWSAGSAATSSW